jgi:hypothetical protein
MSARWLIAILALLLSGCSNLAGLKLLSPETYGLERVSPALYVESGTAPETRQRLEADIARAEAAIQATYGSVQSRPIVHACHSETCYENFGGQGSIAKVYGDRILLSPRGVDWHFIAHEWSHAEIRTRLNFAAWLRLPSWFDEGLAVAVSQAPRHSETHWQYLIANGIKRPTRQELVELESLRQWLDAVQRFGATRNAERRALGEKEIAPLYTAAGHEVRPWLATEGSVGVLRLIAKMNAGDDFSSIYVSHSDPTTW